MENKSGRHWLIQGRVQGVYYRRFAQQQASALGITGWVKNTADGGVEVYAYGTEEQLDKLLKQLRQGPNLAKVTAIDSQDIPYDSYSEFEIHY
jgi:acylphosphatase